MELCIETLPVGMLAVNCYVVWEKDTRQALIIDAGDEPDQIADFVRDKQLSPVGILQTHAHVDHILGIRGLVDTFSVPVYVHPDDIPLYSSPENALPPWVQAAKDLPEVADSVPTAAGLSFDVIHTPGHTPGGVCYHFADAAVLFSGDTLFQGSVGRTDLMGGDHNKLLASIRGRLFKLPEETKVYPGHGPPTSIGNELRYNPYAGG